ncbi:MAG: YHS domain-containing protein [Alphaproteobacteria bacterium]|nr:YHS domain-containing protein [Alphaproteobacteria bacterium]
MKLSLASFPHAVALVAAVALALGLTSLLPIAPAQAGKAAVFTGIVKGVAVGGYDPVAYFTAGKPVKGKSTLTHEYQGATWRFSSEQNLAAFKSEPAKYAPQYGGYCAWAVSQGYTAKGDPNAWKVVNGKLYLNYNRSVQRTWQRNAKGNIKKADANWPTVLKK